MDFGYFVLLLIGIIGIACIWGVHLEQKLDEILDILEGQEEE